MIKEIPNGWELKKLKELGVFCKGTGIPGYSYVDCGVPCIGYGDIYTTYNIQFNKSIHFTDEKTAKTGKLAKQGTLMFTASGETAEEIGKCVCYTGKDPLYVGGDVIMFNTKKVNPVFLAYQQNIWDFIKEKARYGQGHSVVHIHESELGELNCLYPKEIKEQDKIVEVLDAWAKAVDLQEQKVEKLKEKKKALMQKLLTPKDDWMKLPLKDVVDFYNGYTFKSETYCDGCDGKYKVITIANVKNGEMVIDKNTSTIDELPENIRDFQILSKGDILISMTGNVGRVCKVDEDDCLLNQRVGKIVVKKNFSSDFVYYALQTYDFIEKMMILAQGAAQDNMSVKDVNKYKCWIPKDLSEQETIANALLKIEKNILLNKKLLNGYKEQQKALMQKLLTGEIRV